jgi:hypothetical protein
MARVAADLELAANDLYRLRKRVLRRTECFGAEGLTPPPPAAAWARSCDFVRLGASCDAVLQGDVCNLAAPGGISVTGAWRR